MTVQRLFVLLALICLANFTSIDAQSAAKKTDPVSDAIRQTWKEARLNIRESADQMPEAEYTFRPTPEVRTFGQILAHVAGTNYVFCAAAKGEKSQYAEGDFEKTAKTKAQIVKAVNDSLAYCDAAYDALTDAGAAQMPFGAGQGSRALALISNSAHLNEHYGNLVTYFRLKGMVPPSTRREGPQR